jgi:ketosteroid isomerase-like protein
MQHMFVWLLAAVWLLGTPALSHPPAQINAGAQQAVGDEVTAFRKAMADVLRSKDAEKIRRFYAPMFLHGDPLGKTADRDARIAAVVRGDAAIETAGVEDLVIRVPNDWTAIATGVSTLKAAPGKTDQKVRWMAVYTRTETSWQLAASQETRIIEPAQ